MSYLAVLPNASQSLQVCSLAIAMVSPAPKCTTAARHEVVIGHVGTWGAALTLLDAA